MARGEKTGGRAKGTPNRDTALIRDMIAQALDDVGGVEYLASVAKSHPGPFLALVGKVMPVQVTGANGGPIEVRNMTDAQLAVIAAGGSV